MRHMEVRPKEDRMSTERQPNPASASQSSSRTEPEAQARVSPDDFANTQNAPAPLRLVDNEPRASARAASPLGAGAGAGNRLLDRIPPQDLEAEMSLLGSMMLHRDAIGDVLPLIHRSESERLYQPAHRRLFEVLVDMYDRGDAVDLVTV